ncbi:36502_t:CDS:1, partial [Racocetra persica]
RETENKNSIFFNLYEFSKCVAFAMMICFGYQWSSMIFVLKLDGFSRQ